MIDTKLPVASQTASASVRPVIDGPSAAAAVWFAKTRAYPVNHLLCLKTSVVRAHPWLPAELMRLFTAAKAAAIEPSSEFRFQPIIRGDPLPYDEGQRGRSFAPFPTLASVGCTAAAEHWLGG